VTAATRSRADQLRESGHPVFNDRKLHLGTFSTNCSGGATISTIDGTLEAKWDQTLALAQMGDQMEFEALVPVGRWRGYGGAVNFNGEQFEPYTWAAGLASATTNPGVFVTSHVPTIHPVLAAKQMTTIDHISGGRAALNVVAGWDVTEMEMFGIRQLPHGERYGAAQEWVDVLKKVWTSEEPFDFDGKYYHLKGAIGLPRPLQRPHPVLMNAGGSAEGTHFGTRNCDVVFVQPGLGETPLEELQAKIDGVKKVAREEYGREVKTWINSYVVQEDTEQEAKDFVDYYVNQKGDWVGVDNMIKAMGVGDNQSVPPHVIEAMKFHFIAGWAGRAIVGTKEMVVDKLVDLTKIGVDGVLLTWPRYLEGMRQFQQETYPLLEQAGVR
jgi:dimethylsulfone monooxygenase